jgi:hypothetical protein
MQEIPSPNVPKSDENRHLFCQMAVEPSLQDVVEDAMLAGWSEREILSAIIEIADNLMLASACNDDLKELLAVLKKRRN